MNVFERARIGLTAARGARNSGEIEAKLDEMLKSGQYDDAILSSEAYKQLSSDKKSFLQIRRTSQEMLSFYSLLSRTITDNDLPPHGDPTRDHTLADFWKKEPILAGAVYSMSAKMTALSWTVMGKSDLAKYYAEMFSTAASMEGYDWGAFISATAQDFYTTDRGSFWETPRVKGSIPLESRKLKDIGHIDALQCAMTGNTKRPVFYLSEVTGQQRYFKPGEFIHFSSLPSPRELHMGIGYCASSRAWRAAKLLMGLHDYDEEKLSNLPPEGVAPITGLTMDEFQDALELWKSARESNNSLTFPGVLWLVGSNPQAKVGAELIGFSQLPESFDRSTVIDQYVNTLALVFGVDAREFWPISSSSLGTAAESEIQHLKAKGKGPGEFVSIVERRLNGQMPDGVEFAFDTQDINEDLQAAQIAKLWIEALLPLVTGGAPGGPQLGDPASPNISSKNPLQNVAKQQDDPLRQNGSQPTSGAPPSSDGQIISVKDFLRLLADRGVLPNWLVEDKRVVVTDSGISEKQYEDVSNLVEYRWKEGVLTVNRLPAYTIPDEVIHPTRPVVADVRESIPAESLGANGDKLASTFGWLKEQADKILDDEGRNIKGKPIPAREALRGTKVTRSAIEAELERWRNHPILAQYVPTVKEQVEYLERTI